MANPKKLAALLYLTLLFAINKTWAQNFNFQPDDLLQQTTSETIKNWVSSNGYPGSYPGPYTFPSTSHDRYTYLNPGAPIYTPCQIWGTFVYKSLQDYVKVKIDKNCIKNVPAFKYTFTFNVTTYELAALPAPNGGNNISGMTGTMTPHTYTPSITISYNPASGVSYQDIGVFKASGGHRMDVSLTAVTNPATGAAVPLSQLPDCIIFETVVSTQRIDNIGTALPEVYSAGAANGALNLSWAFPCNGGGYKPSPKGVEYELEWTYVDDYKKDDFNDPANVNSQGMHNLFTNASPGNINYNFDGNATRIRVRTPSFAIPLVYERGAIVYRIRSLRPNIDNYEEIIYGDWNLPSSGVISPADPQIGKKAFVINAQNNYSNNLNWQYTINFSEEGKYKHVISYLDGGLKNRQTQTKINTDNNYVIAVDHAFDYEGRPEITSLPTPVAGQNQLSYKDNILVNPATGKAMRAADFDNRGTVATSCTIPTAAPPSLVSGQSVSPSLAEQYYSPANPLVNDPLHRFIPQSEGYPYIQTVTSPENPEKVLAQGGAGPSMQVFAGGHPTSYDYVQPANTELDRLMGTEAGNVAFYPKVLTVDPNGQASVSIVNKYGKPVVSCLSGVSPAGMQPLSNNAPTTITSDLLKNTQQIGADGLIRANGSFSIDAPSGVTLSYKATVKPFMICGTPTSVFNPQTGQVQTSYNNSKFLQLPAEFKLSIADACGGAVPMMPNSTSPFTASFGPNGISAGQAQQGTGIVQAPAPAVYNSLSAYSNLLTGSSLARGKYTFAKDLRFDKVKMEDLAEQLIDDNPALYGQSAASCVYRTEADFIHEEVEKITTSCATPDGNGAATDPCAAMRNKLKEELYPKAKYGGYNFDNNNSFINGFSNSIFELLQVGQNGTVVGPPGGTPCVAGTSQITQVSSTYRITTFTCDKGCDHGGYAETYDYIYDCYYPNCQGPLAWQSASNTFMPYGIHTNTNCASTTGGNGCNPCIFSGGVNNLSYTRSACTKINHWEETLDIYAKCQYGQLHHIYGYTLSHPLLSSFNTVPNLNNYLQYANSLTNIPAHSQGSNCYTNIYRYQISCINYPTINFNGVTYGNSTTVVNNVAIRDIHTLSPDEFIALYNANTDQIAEALLPLHPEYCKLQLCNDGDFVNSLTGTETFSQAQAKSYFRLTDANPSSSQGTDCLVGNDPVYQNAVNKIDMYAKLTHLPGYVAGNNYAANDPRGKTLECKIR